MNIILLHLKDVENFEKYSKYLKFVSNRRYSKIENLKLEHSKIVSLFTGLLVKFQISKELNISHEMLEFEYNQYGKPLLKSNLDYWFSISHSNDYIAFISNSSPVGLDIEKITIKDLKIAKRFFTSNEYEYILNGTDQNSNFFEVWTKKEAYIKMLGLGFHKPISSFDVFDTSLGVDFYTTSVDGFKISICSENLNPKDITSTILTPTSLLTHFYR